MNVKLIFKFTIMIYEFIQELFILQNIADVQKAHEGKHQKYSNEVFRNV
jgi:hypothetical protein